MPGGGIPGGGMPGGGAAIAPGGGAPGGGAPAPPPPPGSAAKNWLGRALPEERLGLLAARSRSAAEPCRSPFESFLIAYVTEIGRLHRNWPFMASIAASLAC